MTMGPKAAVSPSRSQPSKFFHLCSALLSRLASTTPANALAGSGATISPGLLALLDQIVDGCLRNPMATIHDHGSSGFTVGHDRFTAGFFGRGPRHPQRLVAPAGDPGCASLAAVS